MKSTTFRSLLTVGLLALHMTPIPCHAQNSEPLETFTVKEYLGHRWNDELIHFDFDVPATGDLTLTDAQGKALPAQFTGLRKNGHRTTGSVWTVATLEPKGQLAFQLRAGKPSVQSDLKVRREGEYFVMSNEHIALRVPCWTGVLAPPRDIKELPAPIDGVHGQGSAWLGGASWFNNGEALPVKEASTTVLEQGPVRAMVRQKIVLSDGRYYFALITLGARQDVAMVHEESNIDATKAGWRLAMQQGLQADHVFWNNQWAKSEKAETWGLTDTAVKFDKEDVVAKMRPWSYWWSPDLTMWAGFYKAGSTPFVGVLLMNPSQWSPWGYDGFDRTEIPIAARAGGQLDLTLSLAAYKKKLDERDVAVIQSDPTLLNAKSVVGQEVKLPLRREWGITAGTTAEHVLDTKKATEQVNAGDAAGVPKLRFQLLKYGEYPLDEVKDYDFDFKALNADKKKPFLIFTQADVQRARRQATTVPAVKAQVDAARWYIASCGGADRTLRNEGERAFYTKHYWGNGLTERLPEAYLGSDDPLYGQMMAAAVKNLAKDIYVKYLEAPNRPSIGSQGPWYAQDFLRLLLSYELIADSGLLSEEDNRNVYYALVFGAQFLGNPDYWNVERGLASGNPNMTSMIQLPKGLLGLYLAGHPKADLWVKDAETELKSALSDLVKPADNLNSRETNLWPGAFYENPSYQTASLDGMMLMATAMRNVKGKDYFADPRFKNTMEYWGYMFTPPDRRFPPAGMNKMLSPTLLMPDAPPPSTLPSIGDGQAGAIFTFNGWMAAATAKTDPEYSKRQQWYWKSQDFHFNGANRVNGFMLAICDPELPAAPPAELQKGFPGFGSVSRNSWTDPKTSYVLHRTGEYAAHYHDDFNEIVYYAKGAPLALDFGNQYQPVRRDEPWYHNRVSFDFANSGRRWGGAGALVEVSTLPATVDYSYGKSNGGGGQQNHRYVMSVKSADPLGANYVVIRDTTVDGQANQQFWYNLWVLSKEPQIKGSVTHFPGQFDVDLDAHILSPAAAQITKDSWKWTNYLGNYGNYTEEQYGIHVNKKGSTEDFLSVLYPRAPGQAAANVSTLAGGAAVKVGHMEGTDVVLLSPGKPAQVKDGEYSLRGEVALVRHNTDGSTRLAISRGDGTAAYGAWSLSSNGAVSLQIKGNEITGESSGTAHEAKIALPPGIGAVTVLLDGKALNAARTGQVLTLPLPGGTHTFFFKTAA
jgi:hypothetical protein